MNGTFLQKIKKDYLFFGGISFLYGIFFTFCFYKNMYGITFPIGVVGTLFVYKLFLNKIGLQIKKGSVRYIVGMILLGIAISITTNFFFIFFNWIGCVLLFILFMMHQFYNDWEWRFPRYVKNMFRIGFGWVAQIAAPFADAKNVLAKRKEKSEKNSQTTKAVVTGLIISFMLLIVVFPLLLSSDLIFTKLFKKVFGVLNFAKFNIEFNFGTPILILMFFLVGFICCYAFFQTLCKKNLDEQEEKQIKQYNPVTGITINVILTCVYIVYCLVQILYLFIGLKNGLPAGVTYSEYARSGFWELLFVSFINFFLVVISTYIFERNKILKILLLIISGCTFIMIGSSAYRMILYIKQYHLTFLRILVLWFLCVTAIFMIGVILSILNRKFPLFRYIVLTLMCCYIGLNYVRPDVIIAKYNLSQDHIKAEDLMYLFDDISYDAIPVLAEYDLDKIEFEDEAEKQWIQLQIEIRMKYISEENDGIYFRKANYARIKAKKAAEQYF